MGPVSSVAREAIYHGVTFTDGSVRRGLGRISRNAGVSPRDGDRNDGKSFNIVLNFLAFRIGGRPLWWLKPKVGIPFARVPNGDACFLLNPPSDSSASKAETRLGDHPTVHGTERPWRGLLPYSRNVARQIDSCCQAATPARQVPSFSSLSRSPR